MESISLSINPSYYCNFRCDFCYLSEAQLSSSQRITPDELYSRLLEISMHRKISHIDLYGGEIGILPSSYLDQIKKIMRYFYQGPISVITNLKVINPFFASADVDLSVSWDYLARESHAEVYENMKKLGRPFHVLMLASRKLIDIDDSSLNVLWEKLNGLPNLQSLEIKPYSKNPHHPQEVSFIQFENWVKKGVSQINHQARFINTVAIRLSYNNLLNYQHAGFSEFVNTDSSVHIRNICFRPFDFAQYMLSGIQQIITQLSLMLLSFVAIILFNAKLFLLLLLLLLPPVIIVFWFVKKRLAIFKKNIQTSNERSFRYVMDALKGWVEGNIYARNDFFGQRFIKARRVFSTHLFDSLALQTLPARIIEIFAVLGLFILIVIAKWTGNADSDMLITIGAFMAAAYKIIPGMVKIINISGQMKAYEFSLDELDKKEFRPAGIGTDNIQSIELKSISFQYGTKSLLQNFSMKVDKGDFIGISGQSGKGKTTLFNILLGFLPVKKGQVLINNKPVDAEAIKNYWPGIACVRQQGFFILDTLIRNLTLEEEDHDKALLQNALLVSGLDEVIKQFPEGREKMITENGKNISGGQQQRIAIARALYKNASVMLLDEPFNELDEEATRS